jgi:hypothetical protein
MDPTGPDPQDWYFVFLSSEMKKFKCGAGGGRFSEGGGAAQRFCLLSTLLGRKHPSPVRERQEKFEWHFIA